MRLIILTLLLTLSLFATDKIALVIGNKNYTNQTGLNNPIRDAKLLRDTLKDLGFTVIEVYDADVDTISNQLDKFVSKAYSAKIAVIYYAGHGVGVDGKNYLIPLHATNLSRATLAKKLISLDELKEAVSSSQGFGVVFFDACRNSFFSGKIRGLSGNRSSRALVQPQANSKNILVSFSTQAGKLAKDDVNHAKHSPYAIALSEKLKLQKDIRLVMGGVKERVGKLTKYTQVPISRSSLGEDVFCLAKGCTDSQQQVKIVYRDRVVEKPRIPTPKPTYNDKNYITQIGDLMWQDEPYTEKEKEVYDKSKEYGKVLKWKHAVEYCQSLVLNGYDDWRLPSKKELIGLYKNKKQLKNVASYYYWSATTNVSDSSDAWYVSFYNGYDNWYSKTREGYIRCVRGGQ